MKKNLRNSILNIIYEIEYMDVLKNFFSDDSIKKSFSKISNELTSLFNKQNEFFSKKIPTNVPLTRGQKEETVEMISLFRRYIKDGDLYITRNKSLDLPEKVKELIDLRIDIKTNTYSDEDKLIAAKVAVGKKYYNNFDPFAFRDLSKSQQILVKKYEEELIQFYYLDNIDRDFENLKKVAQNLANNHGIPKEKINTFLLNILDEMEKDIITKGAIQLKSSDFISSMQTFSSEIISSTTTTQIQDVSTQLQKQQEELNSKLTELRSIKEPSAFIPPIEQPATPEISEFVRNNSYQNQTNNIESLKSEIKNLTASIEHLKSQQSSTPVPSPKIIEMVPEEAKSKFNGVIEFFSRYSWGSVLILILILLVSFYFVVRKLNIISKVNFYAKTK